MNVMWSADEELAAPVINRKRLQNAKKSRGPAGRRRDAGVIV